MVRPALADNPVIVLFAYIAAFLPWTVVAATDFINPKWRPVRIIRRDAYHNLLFALIPAGYIIFYIYLQALSEDFKEMAAAIVALLFSFLHAARTTTALVQLFFFRRWAVQSIHFLRAVGIHYCPAPPKKSSQRSLRSKNQNESQVDTRDDAAIVDDLLINDTIIDNQLLHGNSHLSIEYCNISLSLPAPNTETGFFRERLVLIFKLIVVPFKLIFNTVRHFIFKDPMPPFRLVPHRPHDIWLNWTIAFVAQGLQPWLLSLPVHEPPDRYKLPASSPLTPLQLYYRRRTHFAGTILSAAALHFWPRLLPTAADVPSPMLWPVWPLSSGIANATPSKTDFLYHAMTDDRIFPFNMPHCTKASTDDVADDPNITRVVWSGYRTFSTKMARIAEDLPPDFADMSRFDAYFLEWFAILLHLGARIVEQEFIFPSKLSPLPLHRVSSFMHANKTDDAIERDVAFQNLSSQLGFRDGVVHDDGRVEHVVPKEVLGSVALPFAREGFEMLAEKNIVAWRVSELVDVWLALVAGEQVFDCCPQTSLSERIINRMSSSSVENSEHTAQDSTHSASSHYRCDVRTTNGQKAIERRRLERQYGKKIHPYWHLEQTLTFMGFSMEFVRSQLARWVMNSSTQAMVNPSTWKPRLKFYSKYGLLFTETVTMPGLSDELGSSLFKYGNDLLKMRSVHVRLVWEALERLKEQTQVNNAPDSLEMMMMCILAFPSLSVRMGYVEESERGTMHVTESHHDVRVDTSRKEEHYVVFIEPVSAPQHFAVKLHLALTEEGGGELRMGMVCGNHSDDNLSNGVFDWQLWRGAFLGRLEGLCQWQKDHDLPSTKVRTSNANISNGIATWDRYYLGELQSFRIWIGFPPFRDTMCLFELENPGFLREFRHTGDVTTLLQMTQAQGKAGRMGREVRRKREWSSSVCKTDSIPRAQLGKSCLMIVEILTEHEEGRSFNPTQANEDGVADTIIRRARFLVSQSKDNIRRALLMLESSAVGQGSFDAVIASVQLLTGELIKQRDVQLAVETVDDHLQVFVKAKNCVPQRRDELERVLSQLLELYEEWLQTTGYDRRAVELFCHFAGWMMWLGRKDTHQMAVAASRRVFLRSRQFELLHVLAVGKEIELRQTGADGDSRDDVDNMWKAYLDCSSSDRGGLPQANDSLSWFQGRVGIELE